ncbi:Breast cancer 2, early onset [Chytridiales sp. JEL 0842]|nr:Breast cancer 2, early onset [Chytridiales sp. JEL 0842]
MSEDDSANEVCLMGTPAPAKTPHASPRLGLMSRRMVMSTTFAGCAEDPDSTFQDFHYFYDECKNDDANVFDGSNRNVKADGWRSWLSGNFLDKLFEFDEGLMNDVALPASTIQDTPLKPRESQRQPVSMPRSVESPIIPEEYDSFEIFTPFAQRPRGFLAPDNTPRSSVNSNKQLNMSLFDKETPSTTISVKVKSVSDTPLNKPLSALKSAHSNDLFKIPKLVYPKRGGDARASPMVQLQTPIRTHNDHIISAERSAMRTPSISMTSPNLAWSPSMETPALNHKLAELSSTSAKKIIEAPFAFASTAGPSWKTPNAKLDTPKRRLLWDQTREPAVVKGLEDAENDTFTLFVQEDASELFKIPSTHVTSKPSPTDVFAKSENEDPTKIRKREHAISLIQQSTPSKKTKYLDTLPHLDRTPNLRPDKRSRTLFEDDKKAVELDKSADTHTVKDVNGEKKHKKKDKRRRLSREVSSKDVEGIPNDSNPNEWAKTPKVPRLMKLEFGGNKRANIDLKRLHPSRGNPKREDQIFDIIAKDEDSVELDVPKALDLNPPNIESKAQDTDVTVNAEIQAGEGCELRENGENIPQSDTLVNNQPVTESNVSAPECNFAASQQDMIVPTENYPTESMHRGDNVTMDPKKDELSLPADIAAATANENQTDDTVDPEPSLDNSMKTSDDPKSSTNETESHESASNAWDPDSYFRSSQEVGSEPVQDGSTESVAPPENQVQTVLDKIDLAMPAALNESNQHPIKSMSADRNAFPDSLLDEVTHGAKRDDFFDCDQIEDACSFQFASNVPAVPPITSVARSPTHDSLPFDSIIDSQCSLDDQPKENLHEAIEGYGSFERLQDEHKDEISEDVGDLYDNYPKKYSDPDFALASCPVKDSYLLHDQIEELSQEDGDLTTKSSLPSNLEIADDAIVDQSYLEPVAENPILNSDVFGLIGESVEEFPSEEFQPVSGTALGLAPSSQDVFLAPAYEDGNLSGLPVVHSGEVQVAEGVDITRLVEGAHLTDNLPLFDLPTLDTTVMAGNALPSFSRSSSVNNQSSPPLKEVGFISARSKKHYSVTETAKMKAERLLNDEATVSLKPAAKKSPYAPLSLSDLASMASRPKLNNHFKPPMLAHIPAQELPSVNATLDFNVVKAHDEAQIPVTSDNIHVEEFVDDTHLPTAPRTNTLSVQTERIAENNGCMIAMETSAFECESAQPFPEVSGTMEVHDNNILDSSLCINVVKDNPIGIPVLESSVVTELQTFDNNFPNLSSCQNTTNGEPDVALVEKSGFEIPAGVELPTYDDKITSVEDVFTCNIVPDPPISSNTPVSKAKASSECAFQSEDDSSMMVVQHDLDTTAYSDSKEEPPVVPMVCDIVERSNTAEENSRVSIIEEHPLLDISNGATMLLPLEHEVEIERGDTTVTLDNVDDNSPSPKVEVSEIHECDRLPCPPSDCSVNILPHQYGPASPSALDGNDQILTTDDNETCNSLTMPLNNPTTVECTAAGGNPIPVSKESHGIGQGVFDNVSQTDEPEAAESGIVPFSKSADADSGKLNTSSKEPAEKGHAIFNDLNDADNIEANVSNTVSFAKPSFGGFTTGSGRPAPLSKQALKKGRALFSELNDNEETTEPSTASFSKPSFAGFTTGSGRPTPLSKEALEKSRAMFSDLNDTEESAEPRTASFLKPAGSGFSTGRGTPATLSKEALEKSRAMFSDLNDTEESAEPRTASFLKPAGSGFSTGLGTPVQLSKAALEKSRAMFSDLNDIEESAEPRTASFLKPAGSGFSTGRGTPATLSKEALEKSRAMFSDLNDTEESAEPRTASFLKPAGSGFSTGLGTPVQLSKAALEKSRAMFSDLNDIEESAEPRTASFLKPAGSGFSTGRGTPATLSKEALEKSRAMFSDLNDTEESAEPRTASILKPAGSGFSTGLGRPTPLSKKAFEKGQAFFNDLPENDKSGYLKTSTSTFLKSTKSGFSSGLGAASPISLDALKRAKALFAEPLEHDASDERQVPKKNLFLTPSPREMSTRLQQHSELKTPTTQIRIGFTGIVSGNSTPLNKITRQPVQLSTPRLSAKRKPFKTPKRTIPIDIKGQTPLVVKPDTPSKAKKIALIIPETRVSLKDRFPEHSQRQAKSWQQLQDMGIDNDILSIDFANALSFKYPSDGPSGLWGPDEARADLLEAGASEKHVGLNWVENHYRLVVWKLAGLVRSFPDLYQTHWSRKTVLAQLLYRYVCERERGQRSVLQKISEGDLPAEYYMTLCVCSITFHEERKGDNHVRVCQLELTDGWYSLKTNVDEVLQGAILTKKISAGQKLAICYANVTGEATPPLDAGDSRTLRIFANGTRLAKWDAKLGPHRQRSFCSSISSVDPAGGIVPCIDIIVVRKYPKAYLDSSKVLRDRVEEDIEERLYQVKREKLQDELFRELESAMLKAKIPPTRSGRTRLDFEDLENIQSGPELHECMLLDKDPETFKQQLSESQLRLLSEYESKLFEEKQSTFARTLEEMLEEKLPKRKVSTLVKLTICDYPPKPFLGQPSVMSELTIWNEQYADSFEEGKRYRIHGVQAREMFGRGTNTAKASFSLGKYPIQPLELDEDVLQYTLYTPRKPLTCLEAVHVRKGSEVDLIGVVIGIGGLVLWEQNKKRISNRAIIVTDSSGQWIQIIIPDRMTLNLKLRKQVDKFESDGIQYYLLPANTHATADSVDPKPRSVMPAYKSPPTTKERFVDIKRGEPTIVSGYIAPFIAIKQTLNIESCQLTCIYTPRQEPSIQSGESSITFLFDTGYKLLDACIPLESFNAYFKECLDANKTLSEFLALEFRDALLSDTSKEPECIKFLRSHQASWIETQLAKAESNLMLSKLMQCGLPIDEDRGAETLLENERRLGLFR